MNSLPSDNPQRWKEKYSEAIREIDEIRADAEANEKLLCRTVIRLALAAGGLDPALDSHLVQIREIFTRGIRTDRLRDELEAITETLIKTPKSGSVPTLPLKDRTASLFDFLNEITFGKDERGRLKELRDAVEKDQFTAVEPLFDAIRAVLRLAAPGLEVATEQQKAKNGPLGRWLARNGGKLPEGRAESELVRQRLLSMLELIEIPVQFRERGEAIKQRLTQASASNDLQDLLNESIEFLAEVKTFIQQEQQEIESFLAVLTGRLGELESQASGADASTQAVVRDIQADELTYHGQFEALKDTALRASDLGELKSRLTDGLDQLRAQMRAKRERELEQLQSTQQQLGSLSGRLQELELETSELRSKLRLAHDLALLDALTGLPNRKAYDERLAQEIARWKRFRHPLTLLVWDVDHFKSINDRFGHAAGDRVLTTIGRELGDSIRETDFVARYGGEEFVMILPGADAQAARGVAEQIRARIEHCGFNSQGRPVKVTVSCGGAELAAGDTPLRLFERADHALYDAKAGGRNRCVFCDGSHVSKKET